MSSIATSSPIVTSPSAPKARTTRRGRFTLCGVATVAAAVLANALVYFIGGAVVYSNELKTKLADVPADLLDVYGAVSEHVARVLAEGIRKKCGTTLGLGVTGVAGPTGGTAEKPVGLVFHALASESGTEVVKRNFPGDRARIRWFASQQALDMVRRRLM